MGVVAERTPAMIERDLHAALVGRRLAGELRLTEDEVAELEQHVEELVDAGTSANGLARNFPALLVSYLSAVGIYRYKGGTFWPNVPPAERLRSNAMGTAFKTAVKSLGLRSFDDLVAGEGAWEYVARILAHGGIPRYCLSDFFGALHGGIRQAGSAEDLLSLWRTRPERLAHLDKPIGRFLRYGGDEARDLVVRCTELVDETLVLGHVPEPDQIGLPEYLVAEYGSWRRRSAAAHPGSRSVRVARPRVEIDPWSTTGPHLILPAFGEVGARWKVVGEDSAPKEIPASDVREQVVRLDPSRSWDVTFESPTVPGRLFAFEAFGELPALLFDVTKLALVRDPLNLRLDSVVCLHPEDATLEALASDGTSLGSPREIERYPTPTGEWRGFRLGCLDLNDVARLRVVRGDLERLIRVSAPASSLSLLGAVVPGVATPDGRSVFSEAPRVLVPEDLRSFEWSARIRCGGESIAHSGIRAGADGLLDVLPEEAFGDFDISVTGVLGFDLQERVSVVPALRVHVPSELLLPNDVGARMQVEAADGLTVDGASSPADLAIPDDLDVATFVVQDAHTREVQIRAQVPRVVWGVVAESGSGAGLSTDILRLESDDVEEGRARALLLRAGKPGQRVGLRLRSRSGVLQEPEGGETRDEGRWAFDLRPFQDAVRQSGDPVLRFELTIGARTVHVADIVVRYVAVGIDATSRSADDFMEVVLTFDESGVMNSRVARLWPLDRPWEDPIEEAIPDGQAGFATLSDYSRIPPGPYLAQIAVDDGWTKRARPQLGAPSTARVMAGEHQRWRECVEALDPSDPLQALQAVVADGHVSDETLDEIDFGEVAPQALAAFVWMLANVPPGETLPHGTNAVRKALLDSFGGFSRALTTAPELGMSDFTLRRVELLSVRGFDKHPERTVAVADDLDGDELRAVWRVAPALASTVDLAVLDEDPAALERLQQLLGTGEDGLPMLSGFRIDPRLLDRPAEQLRTLAELLEIYPGPLLERRTLEAACFELMIAESELEDLREGIRPSEWFEKHAGLVSSLLGVPGYQAAIEPRQARAGVIPWAALPAVTLAAAIHVRRQTALWIRATRALDEALCFAPSLVRHDLIAAKLLIHRLRASGEPC